MTNEYFCLHVQFERQVSAAPHAPALTCHGATLSYAQLNTRANRLAHYLRRCGLQPGQFVGLCLDRSLDTVVAILAVLKAGGAYVPMDPVYPAERVRMIVEDAQCPVVLCHTAQQERFAAGDAWLIVLDGEECPWEAEPDTNPPCEITAESLAYVIYTSGSTGKPKGALIAHANVCRLFTEMQPDFGFGPEDVWTLFHSYAFDFSVWEIWGAFFFGGRLVVVPYLVSRSPEAFYQLLIDEQVTVLNQTPSAFKQLQHYDESLPLETSRRLSLRYVLAGGEYMALPGLAPWFERHGDEKPRFIHVYGITETTVFVTYRPLTRADTAPGTPSFIGNPIRDLTVYVLDESRNPVAIGEVGELYVGGPGVCRGYLNRAELTAERFIPDPFDPSEPPRTLYKSGDLVRRFEHDLEFIGRNDMQVQLRGFRVELGEIEAALNACPGIRSAIVRMREDVPGDQRLAAYYLAGEPVAVSAMREHLLRTLPPYMVPSAFMQLQDFPLNNNGKIDNGALPAPSYGGGEYTAPQSGLESSLAAIWEDTLRASRVGASDNFFAMGGHSLLATRILSRVRDRFGVGLPLRSLYDAPTVAELARIIETARSEGTAAAERELPHADRAARLPLSYAQEQLWILSQLEPGLWAYHIPLRVDLHGPLRREDLERALGMVIERHEALRMVFTATGGRPEAHILPRLEVPVEFRSLLDRPAQEREAHFARESMAMAKRPMNLAEGPLIRAALFELGEAHHGLVLVIHHAVFDGWSISVLLAELADAYGCTATHTPWQPPALAYQYADYAVWQRTCTESAAFAADLAYWKQQLEGPLPVAEMPLDFPRPKVRTWEGARIRHTLDARLFHRIESLAQQLNVTPFVVMLAGWKALLFRYTGQEDCIIGAAMAGRNRKAWEPLIGFFINTVALRTRKARDLPFQKLVERVQDVTLAAQDHQEVPFERVVAEVERDRDPSRTPIFQTMVVYHNTPEYRATSADLVLTAQEMDNGGAKFDLTLAMQPAKSALVLELEYNSALFKPERVRLMLEHLDALLADATTNPARAIGRLNLLAKDVPTARQAATKDDGRRVAPESAGLCLHQKFEQSVAASPAAPAVTCEGTTLSYGDLNAQANRLARYLQELGVGPEVLVGLCLDRSIDTVVAILAVLKAGGAYVPMDPVYPAERVRLIVEDAQCPVVLAHSAHAGRFAGGSAKLLVLDDMKTPWDDRPASNPPCAASASNLAYVIYTSGSTGRPKGALITHDNVTFLMDGMAHWLRFDASDVWTLFHSYAFDFSVWEMWGALFYGGRLVVVPHLVSRSPQSFYRLLIDEGVTVLNQTPSAFQQLQLHDEGVPLNEARGLSLRHVIFGGETLDLPGLSGWFDRHGDQEPVLINTYGITETTVFVTYRRLSIADTKPGTPSYIGMPIPGFTLYVLDENRRPVSTGEEGELYVGGDGVGRGYLRRPELTAERFIPDPLGDGSTPRVFYKTGDLVRLRENDLEFLGRNDMQVQIRGFRVELGEIEAALSGHPMVRASIVRMREDIPGDQRLVAYYLSRNPVPALELREHLSKTLPPYMLPSSYEYMAAFPLNNNGKIDAGALPAPCNAGISSAEHEVPATEAEAKIAALWAELLRVPGVGLRENFFALGGHSLLAIQLVTQINEAFGSALTLADFFEDPTVERLAARLDPVQGGAPPRGRSQLLEIKPGTRTPFFCVKGAGDVGGSYETLAGSLAESQPFFGFPRLEFIDDAPATVENLASQCIREMKAVRPSGPYYIGGYSFGGIVAYEMARQLIEAGDEVPLIAMLDSAVLEHHNLKRAATFQYAWHLLQRVRVRVVTTTYTWKLQIGYIRDGLGILCRRALHKPEPGRPTPAWRDYLRWIQLDTSVQYYLIHAGLATPSIGERRLRMVEDQLVRHSTTSMESSKQAMARYKMVPIPATVTLFRAEHNPWRSEKRDPTYGWNRYARKGVNVVEVPGNHMVIIRHPYAIGLGKALQAVIDQLESSTESG